MMELNSTRPRLIVAAIVIFFLISVIIIVFSLTRLLAPVEEVTQITPTPTTISLQNPNFTSPIQKTIISQTTDKEIVDNYNILETQNLPNGDTKYLLKSPLIPRPNNIITRNGRVIFESILIPELPSERGFTTFSSINATHGEPQSVLTGSEFYGWYIEHRIYPQQGFTATGNPYTDEVYEIHRYEPMSVENYIREYGEDINTNLEPHNETY